jgi:integrase
MRLSEFFERWFLPMVLEAKEASASTILLYRQSIAWWITLTGDPPIDTIDEKMLKDFREALSHATYRRGPAGAVRPVTRFTAAKHLRDLRSILSRLGPTLDPKRPGKGVLPASPYLAVPQPRLKRPKPSFEVQAARAVAIAASRFSDWPTSRRAKTPPRMPPGLWALSLVSAWYYAGFRAGTSLRLRWRMLIERRDGHWWDLPEEVLPKTHKPVEKFCHPACAALLQRLRAESGAAEEGNLIFDWSRSYSHLSDCHELWQLSAGIAEEEKLPPQAWRRTHATQLGLLGLERAQEIARMALDHGSVETTKEFYLGLEPQLIRMLPPLVEAQQRLF